MKVIKLLIAGCVIEIRCKFPLSQSAQNIYPCFRTSLDTKEILEIDKNDISSMTELLQRGKPPIYVANLNSISLLHKVTDILLDYNTFLFHGASVAVNNEAYIFTAPSGIGKTTHILKWLNNDPNSYVVNGDKPFIKIPEDGGSPLVCGSPWAGKENMYTNIMVPIKAIVIMERADNNSMEKISFAEAFPFLLQQIYYSEDNVKMRKTLKLMESLQSKVSFWHFNCNNYKDDCFSIAYSNLTGISLY